MVAIVANKIFWFGIILGHTSYGEGEGEIPRLRSPGVVLPLLRWV